MTPDRLTQLIEDMRAAKLHPEGMTRSEIQEVWGCSEQTARKHLTALIKAGKMECVRIMRKQIDGVAKVRTGYREVVNGNKSKR